MFWIPHIESSVYKKAIFSNVRSLFFIHQLDRQDFPFLVVNWAKVFTIISFVSLRVYADLFYVQPWR